MAPPVDVRSSGVSASAAHARLVLVGGMLTSTLVALAASGCAARRARPGADRPTADASSPGVRGRGGTATAGTATTATEVPSAEIATFRGTRVEDLIQGRVAGVQVTAIGNGDYAVRIRGAKSIRGDDTPLYVIDGTQVRAPGILSALAGVSPQSVERIEVLKDAGATSLYGVQGGNGVIVITTKRGRP